MSVYLANIGLMFIWAFFLLKIKPSEKKRIAFCAIACLQLVLISGLRDWSIGADTLAVAYLVDKVLLVHPCAVATDVQMHLILDIHRQCLYGINQQIKSLVCHHIAKEQ